MDDKLHDRPEFQRLRWGVLHYLNMETGQRAATLQALLHGHELPVANGGFGAELTQRQAALSSLAAAAAGLGDGADTHALDGWLRQKRLENDLLSAVADMRDSGAEEATLAFVAASVELYGEIDAVLFFGCLEYVLNRKLAGRYDDIHQEVMGLLGPKVTDHHAKLPVPDEALFAHYRGLAAQYFQSLAPVSEYLAEGYDGTISGQRLAATIDELLQKSGACQDGWRVVVRDNVERLSVNPASRTVRVANQPLHIALGRLCGLLLHEVGIHVMRRLHKPASPSGAAVRSFEQLAHEEGLGVLVEQLVLRRFHMLRLFRYLAIGLAWGVDGRKRNASEVYEVLWRLRLLSRRSTAPGREEKAKRYAALETMRVFRGIAPQVRGAALLRDKAYVEGNLRIWRILAAEPMEYRDFEKFLRD